MPIEDDDIDFIESDEDESQSGVDYKYYSYAILGNVKKKGNVLTRVIIVNRWLWMTDDSKLRNIYKPLLEALSDFEEVSPAVLDTPKNKEVTQEYLSGLGMREDEDLKYAYKKK